MVSKWPRAPAKSPGPALRWYGWPDVRRPKVVAIAALIAAFATVAVPGPVGSRAPNPLAAPAADLFATVEIAAVRGPAMTTPPLDPGARSDGNLDESSTLFEPDLSAEPQQARPAAAQPQARPGSIVKNSWRLDRNVSWYGPGFYGRRTACGQAMTESLVGVAHKTLPCGTRITFKNPANGRIVTAPVVDRGPYVAGRQWDLTGGLCLKLAHCYTGSLSWKYASGG
jgi:Lytic transglycolase